MYVIVNVINKLNQIDSEIKELLPEATHNKLRKHMKKEKSAFLRKRNPIVFPLCCKRGYWRQCGNLIFLRFFFVRHNEEK